MVKKVTLFFDGCVRKHIEQEGPRWSMSAAYRAALHHYAEIVTFGTCPVGQSIDCRKGYNKYLCNCHEESKAVKQMFREAHRIEAHLFLGGPQHLTLKFMAYRKGERVQYMGMQFSWGLNGMAGGSISFLPGHITK